MRIDSSGRVGIGNSSLHRDTSSSHAITVQDSAGTARFGNIRYGGGNGDNNGSTQTAAKRMDGAGGNIYEG